MRFTSNGIREKRYERRATKCSYALILLCVCSPCFLTCWAGRASLESGPKRQDTGHPFARSWRCWLINSSISRLALWPIMSVSSEFIPRPFLFGRIPVFLPVTAISGLLYIYKTVKSAKSYKKSTRSVKNFVISDSVKWRRIFDIFYFSGKSVAKIALCLGVLLCEVLAT